MNKPLRARWWIRVSQAVFVWLPYEAILQAISFALVAICMAAHPTLPAGFGQLIYFSWLSKLLRECLDSETFEELAR